MKFGEFELDLVNDGMFYLDGGTMFGVVPKVLWTKTNQADERNRIELSLQCLVIRGARHKVVVDTGLGDKMKQRFLDIYSVDRSENLLGGLKRLGLSPEDIDFVINTHLHFDHCGGNTRYQGSRLVPAFPRARYVVQKQEWADATNPNERTKASYLADNFLPIQEAGQLMLVDGAHEVLPGVRVEPTGGHTSSHQMVRITSGGQTAVYMGDLIPIVSQLRLAFITSYDLYPQETLDYKRDFLKRAAAEHWLLLFDHDPKVKMGYVTETNGEFIFAEAK